MTVTDEMVEAGAEALKTVPNYWMRFRGMSYDFPYELCRYGKFNNIVVVGRFKNSKELHEAQEKMIRTERARAVLEAALAKDGEEL